MMDVTSVEACLTMCSTTPAVRDALADLRVGWEGYDSEARVADSRRLLVA